MKTIPTPMTRTSRPRRSMQGLSLVELMIAMTLGLIVLAALVSVFANTSASRAELERVSRQIENGRFAMELLSDDIRHAGFYGEANVKAIVVPGVMPDPCSIDKDVWKAAMPIHIQAYDNGNLLPPCFAGTRKPDTDVLVIRRASTCESGVGDCPVREPLRPYIQIAKCKDETPITPFAIGTFGVDSIYTLKAKNCIDPAELRRYYMRFYYISTDNGAGVAIPTLKRIDLVGASFVETPLVEGIEELNLEYGIDTDGDGGPDAYTADPNNYACGTCTVTTNWASVVTVRINLLARNIEASPGYTDTKEYSLGRDAAGLEITRRPNDNYRRHAYNGLVRIVNASARRDTP